MRLRDLSPADAPATLAWLTDPAVTCGLAGQYSGMDLQDAEAFIAKAIRDPNEVHKVIVTDEDTYAGMVSLRHINMPEASAELTVVMRSEFFGKGYAWFGVVSILKYAFEQLSLHSVYWRVNQENRRAIRFFEKHGFNRPDSDIPAVIKQRHSCRDDSVWFVAIQGDDFENKLLSKGNVAGCRIVRIKTVPTVEAGELSFFEGGKDTPFDIKRIYYISKVPEGTRRGFHAHRHLQQLLFCPFGKIQLILENADVREEVELSDPSVGVLITEPTWREMLWLQKDSVLCVAASDFYDPADYIRDHAEFKRYVTN